MTASPARLPAHRPLLLVVGVLLFGLLQAGTGWAAPDGDGASAATPTTPEQAQAQVADLNRQLATLVDKYNAVGVTLSKEQAAADEADAALQQAQAEQAALQDSVEQMAVDAYTGSVDTSLSALMTSKAPEQLLDRLMTIDYLAAQDSETLAAFDSAVTAANAAKATHDKAVAAATATAQSLQSQKTTIEQQVSQVESLLAQMTADQQQAAFSAYLTPAGGAAAPAVAMGPVPAPTPAASTAVNWALAQIGKPYGWGATGPDAYDCSGLVMQAYQQAGITLPRTSQDQAKVGTPVPLDQLQPGDLVYFGDPAYHIGIYAGDNQMVNAPQTGETVKLTDITSYVPTGATRVAV